MININVIVQHTRTRVQINNCHFVIIMIYQLRKNCKFISVNISCDNREERKRMISSVLRVPYIEKLAQQRIFVPLLNVIVRQCFPISNQIFLSVQWNIYISDVQVCKFGESRLKCKIEVVKDYVSRQKLFKII